MLPEPVQRSTPALVPSLTPFDLRFYRHVPLQLQLCSTAPVLLRFFPTIRFVLIVQ